MNHSSMKKLLSIIFLLFFTLSPAGVSAQEEVSSSKTQIDKTDLQQLYDIALEQGQISSNLERRIEKERSEIRKLIETEIWTSIAPADTEDIEDLSMILARQKKVISFLSERLREQKIDLGLIEGEIQKIHPEGLKEIEDEQVRKTYSGFLTNRAVLEENIDVLGSILRVQEERLQKFKSEQFQEYIDTLVVIGKYLGILLLIIFFQRLIQKFLISRIPQSHKRYAIGKLFTTGLYTIIIFAILAKLFSNNPNILASFAIVGAGLVVALQDVVKDFVGWLMILKGRFSVGDRISLNGITGDVVDINVLQTTLLEIGSQGDAVEQHTGKMLFLPNSLVLLHPVVNANKTSDFLKTEIKIEITFESDWKNAKKILEKILKEETSEFSKKHQNQYRYRTSQFYVSSEIRSSKVHMRIVGSGVEFTIRFDAPVGGRRKTITKITQKILEHFNRESDIDLAYNTMRVIPTQEKEVEEM